MPLFVANLYEKMNLSQFKVLDLCSGCGVVGLEFHFYKPEIAELHFVEVQKEAYSEHFSQNMRQIKASSSKFIPLWINYDQLIEAKFSCSYDIIMANPPYFEPDQGKLSPDDFKNRCRFFLDSYFENFLKAIINTLKPGASAYILLRPLKEHKKDLRTKLEVQLFEQARIQQLTSIRGTDLIQIQKNS